MVQCVETSTAQTDSRTPATVLRQTGG